MRYFLITYIAEGIIGSLSFRHNRFPSSTEIENESKANNLTITNIFEFKSEEDFNNYQK